MSAYTDTAWGMDSLPSDEWLERAACSPPIAELFWPIGQAVDVSPALSVCGHCPVIEECGRYAVEHQIVDGIWGGMREDQLRHLVTGVLDGRRTHVDGDCARCGRFRELTGRNLCRSCTVKASAAGELRSYPIRRDGSGTYSSLTARTHCRKGHPYEANIYVAPDGKRRCRECKNGRMQVSRQKLRSAVAP